MDLTFKYPNQDHKSFSCFKKIKKSLKFGFLKSNLILILVCHTCLMFIDFRTQMTQTDIYTIHTLIYEQALETLPKHIRMTQHLPNGLVKARNGSLSMFIWCFYQLIFIKIRLNLGFIGLRNSYSNIHTKIYAYFES